MFTLGASPSAGAEAGAASSGGAAAAVSGAVCLRTKLLVLKDREGAPDGNRKEDDDETIDDLRGFGADNVKEALFLGAERHNRSSIMAKGGWLL